jgi:hypothetical protein
MAEKKMSAAQAALARAQAHAQVRSVATAAASTPAESSTPAELSRPAGGAVGRSMDPFRRLQNLVHQLLECDGALIFATDDVLHYGPSIGAAVDLLAAWADLHSFPRPACNGDALAIASQLEEIAGPVAASGGPPFLLVYNAPSQGAVDVVWSASAPQDEMLRQLCRQLGREVTAMLDEIAGDQRQ